jgi:flagellar biosynthetic protein FliR
VISVTSAQLNEWLAAFLWPLARILALIGAAPVLGDSVLPLRVKIGLGVLVAVVVAPVIGPLPKVDPGSLPGLLILAQQILIGLAMGFVMRVVFAAVEAAGEIAGLQMGLGFATLIAPESDGSTLVVGQFLSLLATLMFLSIDGHLMMIDLLSESFGAFPVSAQPFSANGLALLADWGGKIFAAGVWLSLPLIGVLLITNLALGILTRASPQLNLLSVGFPITLSVGMVALLLSLPYFVPALLQLVPEGMKVMLEVARTLHASHP